MAVEGVNSSSDDERGLLLSSLVLMFVESDVIPLVPVDQVEVESPEDELGVLLSSLVLVLLHVFPVDSLSEGGHGVLLISSVLVHEVVPLLDQEVPALSESDGGHGVSLVEAVDHEVPVLSESDDGHGVVEVEDQVLVVEALLLSDSGHGVLLSDAPKPNEWPACTALTEQAIASSTDNLTGEYIGKIGKCRILREMECEHFQAPQCLAVRHDDMAFLYDHDFYSRRDPNLSRAGQVT